MVKKLATAFRYPVEYLTQPALDIPTGLVFHRKRASLPSGLRAKIEARARLLALDAVRICQFCGLIPDLIQRNGMQPEVAAIKLREKWCVGKGPIGDFIGTLEHNGVVVLPFDFQTDLLDGFFLPARTQPEFIFIALNTDKNFAPDRRRFTLAHELGHAILHRQEFPEVKVAEAEADSFASEFLMPASTILKDLSVPLTFTNLKKLKEKWGVSMSALARRAKDIGIISPSVYRRTCVFLSSCGYRKREPDFGMVNEKPRLMDNLMSRLLEQGENIDELLLLSQPRLSLRYPNVFKGGVSMSE